MCNYSNSKVGIDYEVLELNFEKPIEYEYPLNEWSELN